MREITTPMLFMLCVVYSHNNQCGISGVILQNLIQADLTKSLNPRGWIQFWSRKTGKNVFLCVWDLGFVPLEIPVSDHPWLALLSRQLRLRVLFGVCIQLEVSHHILELINTGTHRDTQVSREKKVSHQVSKNGLIFSFWFIFGDPVLCFFPS